MTRPQFIVIVHKAFQSIGATGAILQDFVLAKADAVYDPLLEDNDKMQMHQAIQAFASSAEALDDLVEKLAEAAKAEAQS